MKSDADIVEAPFYHIYGDRWYIGRKEKVMKIMGTAGAIRYDLGAWGSFHMREAVPLRPLCALQVCRRQAERRTLFYCRYPVHGKNNCR